MDYVCLHDKREIERCLRKDVYRNIYSIGDLDDFFWPYTTWYGIKCGEGVSAIALIYAGPALPTLVAFADEGNEVAAQLLCSIRHLLPNRFYAHLSPGLARVLETTHALEAKGKHYKMALTDRTHIDRIDISGVTPVDGTMLASIQALYSESYPENWFDPRMLATGQYCGIWQGDRLVSIAGVHVYSRKYKVAALGNITTHPAYRGKGYGTMVTARLCRSLFDEDIDIGLNVRGDNAAAIACYQRIGFNTVASYEEYFATAV
jgi:ribosomal protein S18 acetylase RimI-like enzyme